MVVIEDLIFDEASENYFWKPEQIELDPQNDTMIDENNVDGELCKMGHLLAYYGDLSAKLKTQLARKEEDLDALEAMIDKKIRDKELAAAQTNPKLKPPTESFLKKRIRTEEEYQIGVSILQATRLHFYRVDNLLKAMIKKADALNALAYNQRQERRNF